jgi:hypothetical protein
MQRILDAIARLAHRVGIESLAMRMNLPAGTLRNKVAPHYERNQCSHLEVIEMQILTGARDVIEADCLELGGMFVPVAQFDGVADDALLDVVTKTFAETGDVARVLHQAIADGSIDADEFRDIERESNQAIQAQLELVARCRSMVSNPRRLTGGLQAVGR